MTRHRMIISLNDEVHAKLMKLSEVSGVPASTWVVKMLETGENQIEGLIKTFELIKEQPTEALDALNKMIAQSVEIGAKTQVEIANGKEKLAKKKKPRKKK